MKYIIISGILLFGFGARAQKITQISPPNITFRGMSVANTYYAMLVGDSATVQLSSITTSSGWYQQNSPRPSPCGKEHTLYGVCYYDTVRAMRAIVVGDSGLIFTTKTRGGSWTPSGIGITTQTLRAIVRAGDGSFLIVGDSGLILRSTDSGNTWNRITSSTGRNIYAVAIGPTGHGYFCGDHGLIGNTTDFGATWHSSDTASLGFRAHGPVALRSIAISNTSASIITVGDSGAIGISHDGVNWQKIPISPISIYSNPVPDSLIPRTSFCNVVWDTVLEHAYGNVFQVSSSMDVGGAVLTNDSASLYYFSIGGDADGGAQSVVARYYCQQFLHSAVNIQFLAGAYEGYIMVPGSIAFFDNEYYQNILFASIDSSGFGYATAIGGNMFLTTDNGLSWTPNSYIINQFGNDMTDIHTVDNKHAFAVGWSGALFRTSDGGATWDSSMIDPNKERLHSIASPTDSTYIVCGDYGTILKSIDGAKTWKPSTTATTAYLESVAFSSRDTGVAIGTGGEIIRTTDQGLTWSEVNNPLTGTTVSYRQVQAFPSGVYYAATDSAGLYRSTDHGKNWSAVPNASQTISEEFFNDHIGVIAETAWSSGLVDDTMHFAFTRDGFATKPIEWTMPIVSNNRMVFHFLDSNTFLCLGSHGFVVKVDMSNAGASVTQLSGSSDSSIHIYPNPTTGDFRIDYIMRTSGSVTIQLFSEDGKDMGMLFNGMEQAGEHEQTLTVPAGLHGSFYLRITRDGVVETVPVSFQ